MPSHRQLNLNIRDLIEEFGRSNVQSPNMEILRSMMHLIADNHTVWNPSDILQIQTGGEEEAEPALSGSTPRRPADARALRVREARRRAGTKVKNPEIGPGEEE